MKHLGKSLILLSALLLGGLSATAMATSHPAGYWQYPAIKDYGPVHPRPNAAMQPDKNTVYKVVFDITEGAKDMRRPNPGLIHVARAINVFASAGVPLDHLRFVAVVQGPATASVLDGKAYQRRFKTANPNLKLIAALRKTGVKVQVCGQSLSGKHIANDEVNPQVTITLAALPDLVIWQSRGYAIEQM